MWFRGSSPCIVSNTARCALGNRPADTRLSREGGVAQLQSCTTALKTHNSEALSKQCCCLETMAMQAVPREPFWAPLVSTCCVHIPRKGTWTERPSKCLLLRPQLRNAAGQNPTLMWPPQASHTWHVLSMCGLGSQPHGFAPDPRLPRYSGLDSHWGWTWSAVLFRAFRHGAQMLIPEC